MVENRRIHELDKFIDTARIVMARREHELDPALEARLRDLHAAAPDPRA